MGLFLLFLDPEGHPPCSYHFPQQFSHTNHNSSLERATEVVFGLLCIIFHGEHDPHSFNPSIWPRTREIAIFIFRANFGSDHFFAKFEPGVIFRAKYSWGCILGGHVTGVGFLSKTNARFPRRSLELKGHVKAHRPPWQFRCRSDFLCLAILFSTAARGVPLELDCYYIRTKVRHSTKKVKQFACAP